MRCILLSAFLVASTAAVAAEGPPEPTRAIMLTMSQWQIIWEALGERPAKIVVPVMNDIQRQLAPPAPPPIPPQPSTPEPQK